MRAILVFVLCTLLGPWAQARHARDLPDDVARAYLLLGHAIGDYYVTHHAWPTEVGQVRTHSKTMSLDDLPAGARKAMAGVWDVFERIELQPRGSDLLVVVHYRSKNGVFEYPAVYHPGRTGDNIFQHINPQ